MTQDVSNPSVLDRSLLAAPREATLPIYRWLRDEAPTYWDEDGQTWCLSRHADVVWASKQTKFFSSARGTRPNVPSTPSMINQDEPRHGRARNFISLRILPQENTPRNPPDP